ncbi:hypothetical protein TRFO_06804 [Tritrichomonas foetus]|uniref:Protein kinase domain-containing protein n=1 Tax=Tritrichomonas foetus TaxID=1144522 RepID=A0A1J4JVF7_9EUKA|nr:hypothetical protein TRFO_06804 [Tritrichomonas foetus]|eukprot:OHT03143.1 hypothetical protein TRFO_06804 [Tritrichomonas foetus]
MNFRQGGSYSKGISTSRNKIEARNPQPLYEEMEETDVSINTTNGFNQKINTPNSKELESPSSLMTPKGTHSPGSAIEQFKRLMQPNNSIRVNNVKYTKIEQIGSGRSKNSTIYKVFDSDGNFFALKIVRITSEKALEAYENEISFLNQYPDSERIIKLIDSEITDNEIYMVFELGDTDLRHFIDETFGKKQNKRLSPNYLRYIWQQMLYCVQELHMNKAIHGNLRPENFLFVKGSLKLIDFGIVKEIIDDQTSFEGIGVQDMRGNEYRSPEVMSQSFVKWRTSADVWSLGCILYELAYGKAPYQTLGIKPNYKSITFPKLANFPDFRSLQVCIMGCLNPDPLNRYTIDDLLTHAFIQPFSVQTIFDDIDENTLMEVKQNLINLAIQVHDEFNDNDFGQEAGRTVRLKLAKDFIAGKRMIIQAKSQ